MVGLKSFWMTFSLLLMVASCVPQSKKSECSATEAFNTQLRSCVPVVQGSLTHITSYTPTISYQRYRLSSTTMPFTIYVANLLSHKVKWTHNYNGTETILSFTQATSLTLDPTNYGTKLGTHTLTAEIIDSASGRALDAHVFVFIIDNNPKPAITLNTPAEYSQEITPLSAPRTFSLNISNNGASSLPNYRTRWQLFNQSGGEILPSWSSTPAQENQAFANLTSAGTHVSSISFNPVDTGIGKFYLKARIVFNGGSGDVLIEERVWDVVVKHPALGKISGVSIPAPAASVTAYDNIPYTNFGVGMDNLSWTVGVNTQAQFCVTVDDADGTYPGDGRGVEVRWYLNNAAGDLCTKETNDAGPSTQILCLTDATNCSGGLPFDANNLVLDNPIDTLARNYPMTARVFDAFTSQEYTSANTSGSPYVSPVAWNINVLPLNLPPTVSFGPTKPTGCVAGAPFLQTNCAVTQDTPFNLSFKATDDFYTPATQEGQFSWTVKVVRNGVDLVVPGVKTNCTKAFLATHTPAYNATTGWTCENLVVPSYNAAGPLNPTDTYQVIATLQDSGSPVGGTSQTAPILTWNLVVTESNPAGAPVISAQVNNNTGTHVSSPSYAPERILWNISDPFHDVEELQTVQFRPSITDPERDNLDIQVFLCLDATCASTYLIPPGWINFPRSATAIPGNATEIYRVHSYILPENLLLSLSPAQDIAAGASAPVRFRIQVRDVPSILTTPVRTDEEDVTIYVRNVNPAPVINTATAIPAVGTTLRVFSGYPITIFPGVITDASGPVNERNLKYQWFAKKASAGTWTAISGATASTLYWTPHHNVGEDINVRLCVGDGTAANQPVITGVCSASWNFTPKNSIINPSANGIGTENMTAEAATWADPFNPGVFYSAYADSDDFIYIEKTVKSSTTDDLAIDFRTVRFAAVNGDSASIISNLSLTGTADSLYIAYVAAADSTPTLMVPRIRRIDKSFPAPGKSGFSHGGKFGFSYGPVYPLSCPSAPCTTVPADLDATPAEVTFTARATPGQTVSINGVVFTANPAPSGNQFCDNTFCADVNTTASNLAAAINGSTSPGVQGLTAQASGGVVSISGLWVDDFLDFDGTAPASLLPVPQDGIGEIFIHDNRWYLPVIDGSRGGADNNKITLINDAVDETLKHSSPTLATTQLNSVKASAISGGMSQGNALVLGVISADNANPGLKLEHYSYGAGFSSNQVPDQTITLFSGAGFQSVSLSPGSTGNDRFYVFAQDNTASEFFHVGRYSWNGTNLITEAEQKLDDVMPTNVPVTEITSTIMTSALIESPVIRSVPNFAEARIFFISGAKGYISRVKNDLTVTCNSCATVTNVTITANSKLGVSQILPDLTAGQVGASAGENVRDVVSLLVNRQTTTPSNRPNFGIKNIEAVAIPATSIDAADSLFRPPFVKD